MKTETVILVGILVVGGIVVYSIYQKKNSQLTIGRNGITGQINLSQAVQAATGLLGAASNLFGGGHASTSSGASFGDTSTIADGLGDDDSLADDATV
jgi:hypothetical protein